ncbi:MAG: NADH dehydrogenase [candidate division WS2 bacterium]|uniref:NADH dehydrogenase n=1 Tax=Psychracetigena formicireducens TaxID=2986056 RepID=A0A9E2BHE3_PSYF1|nr:NADH dehydrogenase [Candidatus Psychracetigena formicireducens]MBT9144937.1 NADH dehydrogenase [Candidatus Psychracetigena formicireducens]
MEVTEAILKRRSVRKYKEDKVPDNILEKILQAAQLAPSAKNLQPWRFVVVTDKEIREKLVPACANQKFVGEAPVVIAGVGINPSLVMRCGITAQTVDLSIALTQIVLQATELGLGTCFIGAFHQDQVKQVIGIPEEYVVVQVLTLGYPDEEPAPRPRLSLQEIIYKDSWGNK